MSTSAIKIEVPQVVTVSVSDNTLTVELSDGRTISVPTTWYPRLVYATAEERQKCRIVGNGHGIHWEMLDEDISVENLLAGIASGESQKSFKNWLDRRKNKA
ncbi:MAG: DUF2442 domain-containing protein [Spirochaetales bacterium]|nr:DUF2442 domain-containing protein [Spirochaetales bacterium]